MMRILFLFCFLCVENLMAFSIAFVHLGNSLPDYIFDSLYQARLFNKDCDIFLLANKEALEKADLSRLKITAIEVEGLPKSQTHDEFCQKSHLDREWRQGFWFYTSERFLYLDDFMQHYDIKQLFHLENDCVLYRDLNELMPIFESKYPHIAAVFDNDDRCIPSFMYFATKDDAHDLAIFFTHCADQGRNDMQVIALFKERKKIKNLPIISPDYIHRYGLKNKLGQKSVSPNLYSRHFSLFNSIFDAAALGQYLGGIDPRNGDIQVGFVNETCLINPSYLRYFWGIDELGRKIPYIFVEKDYYRINNLHIHCKNLKPFLSA